MGRKRKIEERKTEPRRSKTLSKEEKMEGKHNLPIAPASKSTNKKRAINDITSFLKREESISPPTIEKKFSMLHYLKNTNIETLKLSCPHFRSVLEEVEAKFHIERGISYSTIEKFLKGNSSALWCDKYSPKNMNECLNQDFCQNIKRWIKLFFTYRNTFLEESNSLCEKYCDQSSNSLNLSRSKFGWKLKGLLVKGRSGVGKASCIKAVAKEINYELYYCGNQNNQIKYLREKNETTQSESVATKINKDMPHLFKTNQSITKFAVKTKVKKQTEDMDTQGKKIQFMHNVNVLFPEEDSTKFYNELRKTVQSSKIPFIMSLVGDQVPDHLKLYDVIDYEEPLISELVELLSLICYGEHKLPKIDKNKEVQKDRFFEAFDKQFIDWKSEDCLKKQDLKEIVMLFSAKLNILFTFLQNYGIDLKRAQSLFRNNISKMSHANLLRNYFVSENFFRKREKEEQKSRDALINGTQKNPYLSIDKYLLSQNQKDNAISSTQPSFEQSFSLPEQCEKQKNVCKKLVQDEEKEIQRPESSFTLSGLRERLRELQKQIISDYSSSAYNDGYIFSKLSNFEFQESEENTEEQISIENHLKIKSGIVKNLRSSYFQRNEAQTTIQAKQLNFIGFLLGKKTRLRQKQSPMEFPPTRFLKRLDASYLNTFTDIVKP